MKEVVNINELAKVVAVLKANGKRIVTTNGCFDILHKGHVSILQAAKEMGDVLIVGLNSDDSVRKLKGASRPINNENDRAAVLAALKSVDFVTIFTEDTPVEFLKAVKPDIHVKGADYSKDKLEETPVVEAAGGKVVLLPITKGLSTTSIVDKIQDG
jgi:rfaE bifunctional protein nucleotidyltransferase chain/domain